ncbi:hypothetical protein [Candidatus Entotheonella palauensis]|uniref:hypothetical protein n=1 Tax=Candidatus Entotheonella palauensis TaxID=93172 RepID=UPI001178875D|nr:hypothetical protein [Candidatus Entotheonella palauensis]
MLLIFITWINPIVTRSQAILLMVVLSVTLSLLPASVQSLMVVPERAGEGPIGMILEGDYQQFNNLPLLTAAGSHNRPLERLAGRYAQLTASNDKAGLTSLVFEDDGSKVRFSTKIDKLQTLKPIFKMTSAVLQERLQWGGACGANGTRQRQHTLA